MQRFKRITFSILLGVGGLLLTLAGFNLLELSKDLVLFVGILLFILSAAIYLFG